MFTIIIDNVTGRGVFVLPEGDLKRVNVKKKFFPGLVRKPTLIPCPGPSLVLNTQ